MNIADDVAQTKSDVAAIKTMLAGFVAPVVDLTPVTTAVAAVQATANDIDAKLTPTVD